MPDPRGMIYFHDMIKRISARFSPETAVAWSRAVDRYRNELDERFLERAIRSGDQARIEQAMGGDFARAMKDLEDPLARTAGASGSAASQIMSDAGYPLEFNARHPNVILYARDKSADLVQGITKDVREATRTVIALGAQEGLTYEQQARAIREIVGLPKVWADAPLRFADEIRNGDIAAATSRRISAVDAAQIRSRINAGTVDETFVSTMREKYTRSLLNRRALTIARTESIRAAHAGLQESWEQAIAQGALPQNSRRYWIVTPDEKLSIEHAQIPGMNPNGRRMDEMFDTTEGPCMYPPSRPNCRCGVALLPIGVPKVVKRSETPGPSPLAYVPRPPKIPAAEPIRPSLPTPPADLSIEDAAAWRADQLAAGDIIDLERVMPIRGGLPMVSDEMVLAAKIEDVPIGRIVAAEDAQGFVEVDRVKEYIRGLRSTGIDPDTGWSRDYVIVAARKNGDLTILEGHHRVTAELLKGSESIRVRVVRFPEPAPPLPEAPIARVPRPRLGGTEAQKELEKEWASFEATEKETTLIRRYQGLDEDWEGVGSAQVSYGLRAYAPPSKAVKEVAAQIDDIIARGPALGREMEVWRGGNIPRVLGQVEPQYMRGLSFRDMAFTSTSTDVNVSLNFAIDESDNVLYRVLLPKGQKGVYIPKITADPLEKEFLLARGTSFTIEETRVVQWDEFERLWGKVDDFVKKQSPEGIRVVTVRAGEVKQIPLAKVVREKPVLRRVPKPTKYTDDELNALHQYVYGDIPRAPGPNNFEKVNAYLRSGKGPRPNTLSGLDAAVTRNEVEVTRVYRGLTSTKPKGVKFSPIRVGNTISDRGFVSTTSDPWEAMTFALEDGARHGATLFEIDLPAGTRGVHMDKVLPRLMKGKDREAVKTMKEVLLPRGARFRVVSIKTKDVAELEHGARGIPGIRTIRVVRLKYEPPPPQVAKAARKAAGKVAKKAKQVTPVDVDDPFAGYSHERLSWKLNGRLTAAEEEAAADFYGPDYVKINKMLRRGNKGDARLHRIANDFDKAIKHTKGVPHDTETFRGVVDWEPKVGSTFTDKGFTSVTTNDAWAIDFAEGDMPGLKLHNKPNITIMRIGMKKGTKVYTSRFGMLDDSYLPRGTKFRVVRKRVMTPKEYDDVFGHTARREEALKEWKKRGNKGYKPQRSSFRRSVKQVTVYDVEVVDDLARVPAPARDLETAAELRAKEAEKYAKKTLRTQVPDADFSYLSLADEDVVRADAYGYFNPATRSIHLAPDTTEALAEFARGSREVEHVRAMRTLLHEATHSTSPLMRDINRLKGDWAFLEEGMVEYKARKLTLRALGKTARDFAESDAWGSYAREVDAIGWLERRFGTKALDRLWKVPTAKRREQMFNEYVRRALKKDLKRAGFTDRQMGQALGKLGDDAWKIAREGRLSTFESGTLEEIDEALRKGFSIDVKVADSQLIAADRRTRAITSYKPSTKAKQALGDASQKDVARGLGGIETSDNEPMDVLIKLPTGEQVGIEVKTLVDQVNDKITMHPESLARKIKWGKKNKSRIVTVVVDKRKGQLYSGSRYYVRCGAGSFRVRSMTPVQSLSGIRSFIEGECAVKKARKVRQAAWHVRKDEVVSRGGVEEGAVPKPARVTPAAQRSVAKLESEIAGNKYETSAAWDAKGKVLIKKKGQRSQVEFGLEEQSNMRGAAVMTHNHPSASPFSSDDLGTAAFLNVKEFRVTGVLKGGERITYQTWPKRSTLPAWDYEQYVLKVYEREAKQAAKVARRLWADGEFRTRTEALNWFNQEIVLRTLKALGWRYKITITG